MEEKKPKINKTAFFMKLILNVAIVSLILNYMQNRYPNFEYRMFLLPLLGDFICKIINITINIQGSVSEE